MRTGSAGCLSIERVFPRPDWPLPVRDGLRLAGPASTQALGWPAKRYEEEIMHPMFVRLFLETDADDPQGDELDMRRAATRARRNRSRMALKVTVRDRDRLPRR